MPITLQYETLLKRAAGVRSETVDVDGPQDVRDLIVQIAGRRGDPLQSLLVDAAGEVRSSVLIFVGDRQVAAGDSPPLRDGDVVTLMSPISGG